MICISRTWTRRAIGRQQQIECDFSNAFSVDAYFDKLNKFSSFALSLTHIQSNRIQWKSLALKLREREERGAPIFARFISFLLTLSDDDESWYYCYCYCVTCESRTAIKRQNFLARPRLNAIFLLGKAILSAFNLSDDWSIARVTGRIILFRLGYKQMRSAAICSSSLGQQFDLEFRSVQVNWCEIIAYAWNWCICCRLSLAINNFQLQLGQNNVLKSAKQIS